jgi:hypothetical protein
MVGIVLGHACQVFSITIGALVKKRSMVGHACRDFLNNVGGREECCTR